MAIYFPFSAFQQLCNAQSIIILDLQKNQLSGTIPACMKNLQYLRSVDLSNNPNLLGRWCCELKVDANPYVREWHTAEKGLNGEPVMPTFLHMNPNIRMYNLTELHEFNCPSWVGQQYRALGKSCLTLLLIVDIDVLLRSHVHHFTCLL